MIYHAQSDCPLVWLVSLWGLNPLYSLIYMGLIVGGGSLFPPPFIVYHIMWSLSSLFCKQIFTHFFVHFVAICEDFLFNGNIFKCRMALYEIRVVSDKAIEIFGSR